jgi:hypothetical protein
MDTSAVDALKSNAINTNNSSSSSSNSNSNNHDPANNQDDNDGGGGGLDVDDIAFAAEAAADAVEAADAVSQQQRMEDALLTCRICGRGNEEGRPILRFLPVDHDVNAARAAPSVQSFIEDIALHIFCGKTASILPSVNQPELEILTKAGLKNKHGIGAEVNAALARTRCAVLQQSPEAKEKQYYLVREFEAHLAAIRHTHIQFLSAPVEGGPTGDPFSTCQSSQLPHPHPHSIRTHTPQSESQSQSQLDLVTMHTLLDQQQQQQQHPHHQQYNPYQHLQPPLQPAPDYSIDPPSSKNTIKPTAYKASAGMIHKPGLSNISAIDRLLERSNHSHNHSHHEEMLIPHPSSSSSQSNNDNSNNNDNHNTMTTDEGKIRCDCGGTHWPTGTPRGAASWRSHLLTKRHQKWAQDNGVLCVDV